MAKKVTGFVKLQIPAGKANPAPPVGTALGPQGINIMAFCKEFNARTQGQDTILPVEITIYADKSFTFIPKTPPAAILLKKEAGIEKGSGQPNRNKVGSVTKAQVRKIAEIKMPDLNCDSIESAMAMVAGAARSMGLEVEGLMRTHGKKYQRRREEARHRHALSAAAGARDREEGGVREVRRDGRGRRAPRRRSASRRSGRARHRRAAGRHR